MKLKEISVWQTIWCLTFFALGTFAGYQFRANHVGKEAVEQGHAVWEVDTSGKSTFKWLPPCKGAK